MGGYAVVNIRAFSSVLYGRPGEGGSPSSAVARSWIIVDKFRAPAGFLMTVAGVLIASVLMIPRLSLEKVRGQV
jgi:hypothetical protein